jgi:hypothetical protein
MAFYIDSFKKIPKVVNARNVAGLQSKSLACIKFRHISLAGTANVRRSQSYKEKIPRR